MKQLLKRFKQISMLLLAISLLGCENNDDDNFPEVIAGFTYTLNVDTGTVTFINTSVNSRNYFWTFGDGTSSTEINPIKTFARGEYKVTLKATNVAGASDIYEDIIVISDVGAPVITLLGDTTMNIKIGGTFTDPGATAADDVDGDITANIVVAGDAVNVNTAGTYIITYNVSDAAGNAATQRTRTVIVAADAVAPVITLTGSVTINITVGDTFTDPGATATDDVDGDITANIVVAGDAVDVNTAGTYIITYNVSDAAGNAATQKTRTVIVEAAAGTSGAYIYATSGMVTIPSLIDNWGSGTTINTNYAGDATYNPSIQLLSGTAWGDVSALAFTEMEAGILSNYSTLEFKIKTTDYTTIRVKVPENEISFNIADGTPLANGWVQMSLPLSNWSNEVATANQFAILEFGAGTILITDVMLSGDGGGGVTPPSDCPAPPAGELLSNGDFEAGESCWQFFAGSSLSTTVNNGGSNSAEIQGTTGAAVGLKQERFAAGILLPNTQYTVSFDIIASGPFGEGGVFKTFTFSESAEGSNLGAIQHILADSVTSLPTTWTPQSFTFTSSADPNFVAGGLSFLIEIVNSSVKLNVDNVVIKKTP
ncbi:MAG: DUF5011 domain-containing protein [Lutibacter sp.]|nr:DUF5011 domain-containing protein [Lutibacter sp.]